jgi:hypothetical protein
MLQRYRWKAKFEGKLTGCYTIMTVEALAKYVKEPVESLKAELVFDGSTQN